MKTLALILTTFLASGVESVEALTIVLAAGVTRGWRSSLMGAGAAVVVLAGLIAGLGPALSQVPLSALRVVVGGLLLAFGLQWLRKAILRASGHKALHDEAAIFAREAAAASGASGASRLGVDSFGFVLAFKGVLLEGLEVIVIVLSFGANDHRQLAAALGAAAAVVLTVIVGVAIHKPLANVPENTTKFVVGLMLTTFGSFWGAEGAGVRWPGDDAAIIAVLAFYVLVSAAAVTLLRRQAAAAAAVAMTAAAEA